MSIVKTISMASKVEKQKKNDSINLFKVLIRFLHFCMKPQGKNILSKKNFGNQFINVRVLK